jgi:hypothetical protein
MNTLTTTAKRKKAEFDKKLKQIESDEIRLLALEKELSELQMRFSKEAIPLVEEFCQLRFENITKLQQHLATAYFKKKEKRHIVQFLIELAFGLQEAGDSRAQYFLNEFIPEIELKVKEDEELRSHQFSHDPIKEKNTEGKVEIKSLFRQLAKAFHPDKEIVEHLKEEKTILMKKITAAYENQDLYGLLKLEKEHLGHREFTEDKIELYVKYINERLKKIKYFEGSLKKHGPLSGIYKTIYSQKVTIQEYNIKNEISKFEAEIEREKELQQVLWDASTLKNFMKI